MKRRILLIDDDYGVIENLKLYLGEAFYSVESLTWIENEENLAESLRLFQPDGVILDFQMDPPGSQICRWIKQWNQDLPVVFYTSYGQNEEYRNQMRVHVQNNQIIEKREVGQDAVLLLRALGF